MKYLIIGATGTLGHELTRQLLEKEDTEKIICFSRCELKQKKMRDEFKDARLYFRIGDICDESSIDSALRDEEVDALFHVAALKHIDSCEENPIQSLRVNVYGTIHVAEAAIRHNIPHMIFSSTDKACDPINTYGISKALSEKILLRYNRDQKRTHFSVYRWGNILFSRGSAFDGFIDSLKRERKIYVTDLEMTRFWISIEDAASFVLQSYQTLCPEIQRPPLKAAKLSRILKVIASSLELSRNDFEIIVTGKRAGEKIHESIVSIHAEDPLDSKTGEQYSYSELTQIIQPYMASKI